MYRKPHAEKQLFAHTRRLLGLALLLCSVADPANACSLAGDPCAPRGARVRSDQLRGDWRMTVDAYLNLEMEQQRTQHAFDREFGELQAFMQGADRDGDGVVTVAEARNLALTHRDHVFDYFDRNGDGVLQPQEQHFDVPWVIGAQPYGALSDRYDQDGDGNLTIDEYGLFYAHMHAGYDLVDDDVVDALDADAYADEVWHKTRERRAQQLDGDGDGLVTSGDRPAGCLKGIADHAGAIRTAVAALDADAGRRFDQARTSFEYWRGCESETVDAGFLFVLPDQPSNQALGERRFRCLTQSDSVELWRCEHEASRIRLLPEDTPWIETDAYVEVRTVRAAHDLLHNPPPSPSMTSGVRARAKRWS